MEFNIKISKKFIFIVGIIILTLIISSLLIHTVKTKGELDQTDVESEEKINMKDKTPKELFDFKVACEKNSKGLSIDRLFRNPSIYADGTIYKFSGRVDFIRKDDGSTRGLLEIKESDTLVCFQYNEFLNFLEDDIVILYGNIMPDMQTYTSTYANGSTESIQTFGINIVYAESESDVNEYMSKIEDYEWQMICGNYKTDDDVHLLDKTLNITQDTINGTPYSIKNFKRSFPSNVYYQHLASEGICLEISWIDKYGKDAEGLLTFNLNGEMSYMGTKGASTSIYNLDVANYIKQY